MELFRLPHNLLKVGMPVEDLYRYNAWRGLLGQGALDAAIERRMQYLVMANHMRAKAKSPMAQCSKLWQPLARRRLCHQPC